MSHPISNEMMFFKKKTSHPTHPTTPRENPVRIIRSNTKRHKTKVTMTMSSEEIQSKFFDYADPRQALYLNERDRPFHSNRE
jgi:hypothetical protein